MVKKNKLKKKIEGGGQKATSSVAALTLALPPPKKAAVVRGDMRKPKRKRKPELIEGESSRVEPPNNIVTDKIKVKKKGPDDGLDQPIKKKRSKDPTLAKSSKTVKELRTLVSNIKPIAPTDAPTREEKIKLKEAKAELQGFRGTFRKYVPEAQMLLNREELVNGGQLIQRAQLMMMLANIPVAEDQYRKNPTQSYAVALTSFISSVRELMADIEEQRDTSALANSLINEVVAPMWQTMASGMVLAIKRTQLDLAKLIEDPNTARAVNHRIEDTAHDLKVALMEHFNQFREKISKRISED